MTNSPRGGLYVIIAPMLAGSLAGGFTSVIVSASLGRRELRQSRVENDPDSADATPVGVATSPADRSLWKTVLDVQTRVAVLERRAPLIDDQGAGPSLPSLFDEDPGARPEARHDEAIERHRSQSVDPNWGPRSGATLRAALEKLGKISNNLSVGEVDCRSTSCTATARWTSTGDARQSYGQLLTADFGDLDCTREILLPQQNGDPREPIAGTLVLNDCRRPELRLR
jgi:hypothetical protein